MDKNQALKEDGKVFTINNLKIEIESLHNDYDLLIHGSSEITETGHLPIFHVLPKNQDSPKFVARWDQRAEIIDIDIYNTDKQTKKFFLKEVTGYEGHHPVRLSESPRLFAVNIKILDRLIFKSKVTFNVHRRLSFHENIVIKDSLFKKLTKLFK